MDLFCEAVFASMLLPVSSKDPIAQRTEPHPALLEHFSSHKRKSSSKLTAKRWKCNSVYIGNAPETHLKRQTRLFASMNNRCLLIDCISTRRLSLIFLLQITCSEKKKEKEIGEIVAPTNNSWYSLIRHLFLNITILSRENSNCIEYLPNEIDRSPLAVEFDVTRDKKKRKKKLL